MFVQSTNQWRIWRFELEGKLSWRKPTGLCRWPISQHSKKTWEIIVNTGVCGYTKNPNQRKISEKRKKTTTYWKAKQY